MNIYNDLISIKKQHAMVRRKYGVTITESNYKRLQIENEFKLMESTDLFEDYGMVHSIIDVARSCGELFEKQSFRVDPKSGALVNYKVPENGDHGSVAARPDLYWRDDDDQTNDAVVVSSPL